jgi:hypothetical protein
VGVEEAIGRWTKDSDGVRFEALVNVELSSIGLHLTECFECACLALVASGWAIGG